MRALLLLTAALLAGLALFLLFARPEERGPALAATPAAASPRGPAGVAARPTAVRPAADPALFSDDPRGAGARRAPAAAPGAERATAGDGSGDLRILSGRVVDPHGRPVVGAHVHAVHAAGETTADDDEAPPATTTGPDGRFACPAPRDGSTELEVRAEGFVSLRTEVTGRPTELGLEVGQLVLSPAAPLAGRVVDELGRAVAGARLSPVPEGASGSLFTTLHVEREVLATTGADGSFRIAELPEGPWHLLVRHDEHPETEFEGSSPPGGSAGVVLELPRGRALSGRVVAEAGADLSKLTVRAVPKGGIEVSSLGGARPWRDVRCAQDGSFRIGGLALEAYTLRAHDGDGGPFPFSVEWRSDPVEARAGDRGVLVPLFSAGNLRVRVVDAEDGAALVDCGLELVHVREDGGEEQVELAADDPHRSVEQDTGTLVVAAVRAPPGTLRTALVAWREGYHPAAAPTLALAPGTTDFGTVTLRPRRELAVRVVDAGDGAPVEDARVWLELEDEDAAPVDAGARRALDRELEQTTLTDAAGLVRLPRIEDRALLVQASHERYASGEPAPLAIRPGQSLASPALELRLHRGGELEVRVVEPGGGPAGSGLEVVAAREASASGEGWRESRRTDDGGRVTFGGLEAGGHRVWVEGLEEGGIAMGRDEDERGAGAGAVQTLELAAGERRELTLQRPPQGWIEGRVTEVGRPLVGATCRAEADGFLYVPGLLPAPSERSDSSGRFRLGPLRGGLDYDLVVEHPSRVVPTRREVRVDEGTARVDLDLPVTGVAGRVLGPDGRPVAGAVLSVVELDAERSQNAVSISFGHGDDVRLSLSSDDQGRHRSAADGGFELRGLPAGRRVEVRAEHPALLGASSEPFERAPTEMRTGLELRLGAAGALRVVAPGAAPASVTLVPVKAGESGDLEADPAREGASADLDEHGLARLEGLAPGTWRAVCTGEDGRVRGPFEVEVRAGATAELTLP